MRGTAIIVVAATLATTATGAGAIDPFTADPVARGVLLAAPAVYRVTAVYHVPGVRLANGTVITLPPAARTVTLVGTGFAVAADGVLVSAAHVAAPDAATLVRNVGAIVLAQRGQRNPSANYLDDWITANAVHPLGTGRPTSLTVEAAQTDPGSPTSRFAATAVPGGRSAVDDLVLLRVPATGIATIPLDATVREGLPVATIGFGAAEPTLGVSLPPIPTIRMGPLGPTGTVNGRGGPRHTEVMVPVQRGDSGAPAVDADGAVHGVVRWMYQGNGMLVQAHRVQVLLRHAGVAPTAAPAQQEYRAGMLALWEGRLHDADTHLWAAHAAQPRHTMADPMLARLDALREVRLTGDGTAGRRAPLLGLATLFALAAAACGWGVWRGGARRMRG